MPNSFSAPSREQFPSMKYKHSPKAKQQEFIEGYKDEFTYKPICGSKSIKAGDYLVRKGKWYDHHMLCADISGEKVNIIEYTVPAWSIEAAFNCVLFKDITGKGKIAEKEYSVKALMEDKVEVLVWPDDLERFPGEEIISRARTKLGETRYDLLKNNCEHFATWSTCGLKVSLQVKSYYIWVREVAYSAITGFWDFGRNVCNYEAVIPSIIKVIANISDEFASLLCRNAHFLGYLIAVLMEACLAYYEIQKARNDHSMTKEEYRTNRFNVLVKAGCRLFFGIGGSLVGGLFYGAIGAGLGHFIGAAINFLNENWSYMDG